MLGKKDWEVVDAEAEQYRVRMKAKDYHYIGKDGKTVLARDLEDQRDALASENAALRSRLEAVEKRAYWLAIAIMGGEDAPGYADSIETDALVDQLRRERRTRDAWTDTCVKAALATARRDAYERAIHLMPRYFGVWSSTGVHIGVWDDGATAAKVLGEYPQGVMRDLIDVEAIRALANEAP